MAQMVVKLLADAVRVKPVYAGDAGRRRKRIFVDQMFHLYQKGSIDSDEMRASIGKEIYEKVPAGTEIEARNAHHLIGAGKAEPVTKEAQKRAGFSDAKIAAAHAAAVRIERGQGLPESLAADNLTDEEVATRDAKRKANASK